MFGLVGIARGPSLGSAGHIHLSTSSTIPYPPSFPSLVHILGGVYHTYPPPYYHDKLTLSKVVKIPGLGTYG